MGNEQSSAMSAEAREAEDRQREAMRAAIHADMNLRKEEAKKRIRAERAAHAASLEKTTSKDVEGHPLSENARNTACSDGESPATTTVQRKEIFEIDSSDGGSSDDSISDEGKNAMKRAVEIESDSEDDDWISRPQRKRKKAKPAPALYKASVKELAESGITVTGSTADIDNDMMLRIKKCIDRANHPNTPEAEAKRALLLAKRLMRQYNVTQAEVLAHEPPDVQRQYAGQSVVSVTRVDGDKTKLVRHYGFVDTVCQAMNLFFDCKNYSTSYTHKGSGSHFELTFYGIAENTVAAALAFEMTYNLISEWARSHKGIAGQNSYCLGISDELYSMAVETRAAEEEDAKKKEKLEAAALAARERQEEVEKQARLDRLAPLSEDSFPQDSAEVSRPSNVRNESLVDEIHSLGGSGNPIWLESDAEDSDDEMTGGDSGFVDNHSEDDHDTFMADFEIEDQDDEEIESLNDDVDNLVNPSRPFSTQPDSRDEKPHVDAATGAIGQATQDASGAANSDTNQPGASRPSEPESEAEVKWASHMQLVKFRETAMHIAEEHAKSKGLKLKAGKKRSTDVRDHVAYRRGVKDGRKIDVHRRTIKE